MTSRPLSPYAARRRAGFTAVDLTAVIVILLLAGVAVAMVLPMLGGRGPARPMQNNTQLRGIQQGMLIYAGSNKSGGQDGFYPGLTSRGRFVTADHPDAVIQAGDIGQTNDIAAPASDPENLTLAEMNDAATGEGFMQYAFAALIHADTIPAGSTGYLINPADHHDQKGQFVPLETNDMGRFDMSKVSYTFLNVAVDGYVPEWGETINTSAIVLGDRAVGDGNTFGDPDSAASSVWTEAGSGDWRGGLARNDGSVETQATHAAERAGLKYGDLVFEDHGSVDNLFAHPDDEALDLNAVGEIERTHGVLFDQDESGAPGGV